MDRSWMKANRLSSEYENGLLQYFDFVEKILRDNNEIFWCPCMKCYNTKKHSRDVIFNHCDCDGTIQNYTKLVWHDEGTKKRPCHKQLKMMNV